MSSRTKVGVIGAGALLTVAITIAGVSGVSIQSSNLEHTAGLVTTEIITGTTRVATTHKARPVRPGPEGQPAPKGKVRSDGAEATKRTPRDPQPSPTERSVLWD